MEIFNNRKMLFHMIEHGRPFIGLLGTFNLVFFSIPLSSSKSTYEIVCLCLTASTTIWLLISFCYLTFISFVEGAEEIEDEGDDFYDLPYLSAKEKFVSFAVSSYGVLMFFISLICNCFRMHVAIGYTAIGTIFLVSFVAGAAELAFKKINKNAQVIN
ncbi:hypothetical protein [Teredinibacter purpureus]|uniref:hypothetical protein n=1 Tax=Teredinibacter purpureus TaxID=2731756 RepID=UPI0005F83893|nr:hypothetical protein [Teredinibacter purpureus]